MIDVMWRGGGSLHNEGVKVPKWRPLRRYQPVDMFYFCTLLKKAFYTVLNIKNITDGLRRARIHPFDPTIILGDSLRATDRDSGKILTPRKILEILRDKWKKACVVIYGFSAAVRACGYVENSLGAMMNLGQNIVNNERKEA